MYSQSDGHVDSPLTLEDVNRIDETALSRLDKHFLRVLAHCLACFKLMSNEKRCGSLPSEQTRLDWLRSQHYFQREEAFVKVLLEQFAAASKNLEKVADHYQISPLELSLELLISFLEKEAIES